MSGIFRDPTKWLIAGFADKTNTNGAIAFEAEIIFDSRRSMNERCSAANDDALFYCRAGSRNCIFQTVLLLFKFHFGMRTNLDDANATGKFCNSLL